jgi:hypothetical protein
MSKSLMGTVKDGKGGGCSGHAEILLNIRTIFQGRFDSRISSKLFAGGQISPGNCHGVRSFSMQHWRLAVKEIYKERA